jgi:uncharacterized protein involved in exopolysaccharide biosynthesis
MTAETQSSVQLNLDDTQDAGVSFSELFAALAQSWKLIIGGAMLAGTIGLGVAFVLPPTYTARAVILPPQMQQSGAAAALASLGGLAGVAGAAAGVASPADRYVAMLQSITVSNRVIDQFNLMGVYAAKLRVDAQRALSNNVRINAGKKDGLLTIEVEDESPQRSADMANGYVDELRSLTKTLAVTEAQQRRMFFEQQLQATKERLTKAQIALQESGFNAGALNTEPKAAAESYARLKAEIMATEVKLQIMRGTLADNAPDIVQQQNTLAALRRQLSVIEVSNAPAKQGADYVGRYRDFKYQETLFDMFARQYELARVDESRDGTLIQVLDVATPPERRSKPKRLMIALVSGTFAGLVIVGLVLIRYFRVTARQMRTAGK